jgi:hypothetical protein
MSHGSEKSTRLFAILRNNPGTFPGKRGLWWHLETILVLRGRFLGVFQGICRAFLGLCSYLLEEASILGNFRGKCRAF